MQISSATKLKRLVPIAVAMIRAAAPRLYVITRNMDRETNCNCRWHVGRKLPTARRPVLSDVYRIVGILFRFRNTRSLQVYISVCWFCSAGLRIHTHPCQFKSVHTRSVAIHAHGGGNGRRIPHIPEWVSEGCCDKNFDKRMFLFLSLKFGV